MEFLLYDLRDIFYHEFNLMEKKFHANVNVYDAWSVTYNKGDYHEPQQSWVYWIFWYFIFRICMKNHQ